MNPALILTLAAVVGSAAPKAMHIRAGEVHFDQKSGDSIYRRGVQLQQDGVRISAREARIVQRKGRPAEVRAHGTPALFEHQPPGQQLLKLRAETLYYDAIRQRLELTGDVQVDQGQDHIRGAKMVYFVETDQLTIDGGTQAVTAELLPARKTAETNTP